MNQFPFETFVNLLAQVVDIHVDKIRTGIKMGIPDLFRNLHTTDDGEVFLCQVARRAEGSRSQDRFPLRGEAVDVIFR